MNKIVTNRSGSLLGISFAVISFLIGVVIILCLPGSASANGVGSGAGGISGSAGVGGDVQQMWQTGDMDANAMLKELNTSANTSGSGYWPADSARHFNKIFQNWNNSGSSTRAKNAEALRRAIDDCKKNSSNKRCDAPRVVTIGILQTTNSKYYNGKWGPAALASGKTGRLSNIMPNYTWKVNGRNISKNQKLGNNRSVNDAINAALNSDGKSAKGIIFVVVSKNDVSPKKGWKPDWEDYTAFDIKTTSNETTGTPITGIAEYSVHVEGYDGYVKGMSTTPKSYQTPFGSLLAAVNRGDNEWQWAGGHGTGQKTFKNLSMKVLAGARPTDPSGAVRDANANIKAAAEWAIAQTDKMTIDFKIEDAPGVNGMTGKDLTEAFKKGGQYKIVKKRKLQTIQFTGMNVDYYRRPLSGYYFKGWKECTEGEAGCSYIGKTTSQMAGVVPSHGKNGEALNFRIAWLCPAPTDAGANDPYASCIYRGPEPTRGNWERLPHKDGPDNDRRFFVNSIKDKNFRWEGMILWTVQAGRNKGPEEGGLTLGRNYKDGFKWLYPNWEREAYAGTNDEEWITTDHFKPAPNAMQSPVIVALQDFVHVNCNKKDFDAYAEYVNSLRTPQGDPLLDGSSVRSTKYDGYFNTKLVTDPNPVNVKQQLGSMTTVLLRLNGVPVFKPGDKLTNGKEPTLTNWQIQWGSTKWNTPGANSGQLDPTYTKECPFDCVADASVVRMNIRKGVANDPQAPGDTRTGPDIIASDAYGVQVWPSTNGQDPVLSRPYKSNTSHMQFFRNNEWNYFTVDRWAPATRDGIRYDGGDAKSTTIVRNADGSPWMTPNGHRLTNMDANVGGWQSLFTGDGVVVNQWSSSTNDRFVSKTSNQIGGQATQFRIKSAWATSHGKPLKFNVKWEYEVDNTVRTPTVWTIRHDATRNEVSTVTTQDQTTKVDGKCDSQFNKTGQVYQDHTDYAQQGTGVTRKNTQDVNFEEDNPLEGWFSITFIRATSE